MPVYMFPCKSSALAWTSNCPLPSWHACALLRILQSESVLYCMLRTSGAAKSVGLELKLYAACERSLPTYASTAWATCFRCGVASDHDHVAAHALLMDFDNLWIGHPKVCCTCTTSVLMYPCMNGHEMWQDTFKELISLGISQGR